MKGSCGRCGKEGHNAWHCPEKPGKKKEAAAVDLSNDRIRKFSSFEDLALKVEAMRTEHPDWNSLRIAGEMGCTMTLLGRVWKKLPTDEENNKEGN